jgi:hypothetical protein
MFDKVSQVAEKLAINVSRRAFLGRLGQGALVLAGAIGAMVAFPGLGQAKGGSGCQICWYACPDGTSKSIKATNQNARCKSTLGQCVFAGCT